MSKSPLNTTDLVEADFRKIQRLILEKHGKEFTLDYIRKVCKGKRNNIDIKDLAEQYLKVLKEMENRFDNLSKSWYES